NVYIPKEFNVYTYAITKEYTCSFTKDEAYEDDDYYKYMVDLHGTSERCFSEEIGKIYSCPMQLKPEALSQLIDTKQYTFKADIDYTYAVKSTVQFSVINSMAMGVMEYEQCPQRETYKDDQYVMLTCDNERDYYYMCDQDFINTIITWYKDSVWDEKKHCYDYTVGIGADVYTELKIDNPANPEVHGKLIKIGNVASYLAARADTQASRLSGTDNQFLDDATLIASNINAYSQLKKRALLEGQQVGNILKANIRDRIVGMIEYTHSNYFLSKKEYEYDAYDYADWTTDHPYTINLIDYTVEDLSSLVNNDIKNIMPSGQATKPEHIVFMGDRYPMASTALNDRVNELNTIDYAADCTEHYKNNPESPRFCVETNPCHEIDLLGLISFVPCVEGVCAGSGVCPEIISDQMMEINTLVRDLTSAYSVVETLLKKEGKTKEDFSKILLSYELNKIMTDNIVPDAIGVEMNYDCVADACCNDEGDAAADIFITTDDGNNYCLHKNGTLCGAGSGDITLNKFHAEFVAKEDYAYREYNIQNQNIENVAGSIRNIVDEILRER
ncbi:MAG: hypothetical protein KAQ92_00860, partial [Candidatus Aenigmarchaeota archaeon]|nr:hypothetical protein [Candidatus Aenigmarchaeota archaeon]